MLAWGVSKGFGGVVLVSPARMHYGGWQVGGRLETGHLFLSHKQNPGERCGWAGPHAVEGETVRILV